MTLTFGKRRLLPVVLQAEQAECGLACLAMVASYFGRASNLTTLRQEFGLSRRGATLRTVMDVAEQLAMTPRALRLEVASLADLALPAILHWNFEHFVVLKRVRGRNIIVHDPAVGVRRYSISEVEQRFTGVALELAPRVDFAPGNARPSLTLMDFWKGATGLGASMTQMLVLSVLIQVVALATPFYMQIVVDDVLVKHDADLLGLLATGFLGLTLVGVVTKYLRGLSGLYLANQLSNNIGNSVLHHLLRLPLSYFEKRHIGDVVSRFGSLRPVQEFITQGTVAIVIDGLLSVTTLVLMIVYAPALTAVVGVAVVLYAGFRLIQFHALRNASHEQIAAEAELDSTFMESIRSLQGIKLAGRELERQSTWRNRFVTSLNAGARVGRLSIGYEAANSVLTGCEYVAVIYLGARSVMATEMTIGMLYAFMAYRSHFSTATTSLVNQFIEYRMISLHLERLADITATATEPGLSADSRLVLPIAGNLRLDRVSFSYAPSEPAVVEGFSVEIGAGEFAMIFGPSGAGKTTLLKLLMGLVEPSAGQLLVDDQPLSAIGLRSFRSGVAAVMQDDVLFSGSLKANIAFFDLQPDLERIVQAAEVAGIHRDVLTMPMGYDSLIGDMGASLSMGQQQRVLLARALYSNPTILFLDEGTAHVDAQSEGAIFSRLRKSGTTCIYISHNPLLQQYADVIIRWGSQGARPVVYRRSAALSGG